MSLRAKEVAKLLISRGRWEPFPCSGRRYSMLCLDEITDTDELVEVLRQLLPSVYLDHVADGSGGASLVAAAETFELKEAQRHLRESWVRDGAVPPPNRKGSIAR